MAAVRSVKLFAVRFLSTLYRNRTLSFNGREKLINYYSNNNIIIQVKNGYEKKYDSNTR